MFGLQEYELCQRCRAEVSGHVEEYDHKATVEFHCPSCNLGWIVEYETVYLETDRYLINE